MYLRALSVLMVREEGVNKIDLQHKKHKTSLVLSRIILFRTRLSTHTHNVFNNYICRVQVTVYSQYFIEIA